MSDHIEIIELADLSRPELALFARLTEAQLRNKYEPEQGVFIAESAKVISLALDAGCRPLAFLLERKHIAGQAAPLLRRCGGVPVYTGERSLLAQLTGFQLTRGVLCAMRRPQLPPAEALCREARRLVVLENLADSTNVGAIFRSAAALGVDALLLTPSCCDPLCRRAIRVSMGAVFLLPWTRLGDTAADWPQPGLERLQKLGFKTVALALRDDAVSIADPRLGQEERLALILGAEGDGLGAATIAACDYTARIPMSRGMDSLNVAAAGAVAFWQLQPGKEAQA